MMLDTVILEELLQEIRSEAIRLRRNAGDSQYHDGFAGGMMATVRRIHSLLTELQEER